jgi:starch phosphorylase
VVYPLLDFSDCPLTDTGKVIDVPMGRGRMAAKIWVQKVGRVPLILLDSDIPRNAPKDRTLTRHLYGGDREYRIRQEILLGVGGAMALRAMEITPSVYHLNEGHAAFCAVHRLRELVAAGRSFESAVRRVRESTVFTTHTPVPAGNERFAPKLAWKYLEPMATAIGLDRRAMMGLGREEPENEKEDFCMTVLALRLAEHCNGVAELHGETSRKMWKKVYKTDDPSDVPIGHVTNGVHTRTWLAPEMDALYAQYLKPDGDHPSADGVAWGRAERIPVEALWAARGRLRHRMIEFIRQRLVMQLLRQRGSQEQLDWARAALDEQALTIGFARRFATYKRAPLIFRDARRLAKILNDPRRPVQLVFAGKAHPADTGGQGFAQEIYRHAEEAKFRGRVVVLEDYDLEMGRMLTSGCDIWLNNPRRPQEASGTSGMKPPLHGGINCSILDGWWPEAYNGRNGWEIGEGVEFENEAKQDRHDAECIYRLLENQIVPEFYDRDRAGVPRRWVKRMIKSMKTVCSQFNTHRMVREYWEKYYSKAGS